MSGDGEPVLLTEESDAVLTVTLNRPDRLNALDPALMVALARRGRTQPIQAFAPSSSPAPAAASAPEPTCASNGRSATPRPTGLRIRFNPHVLALAIPA